jgi:hypothetical protein
MSAELEAALLASLVGVILGSLGTYVFDIRKEQRGRIERERVDSEQQRRHRASVATALIQDLRLFESAFRQFYDTEAPSRAATSRPRLYFDALMAETRFFAPESIHPIAELHRRIGHYFITLETLRAMHGGRIQSSPQLEYELRCSAAFILQALPPALRALRNEGGIVADDQNWTNVLSPALPPVPDPIFVETVARLSRDAAERLRPNA